MKQANGSTRFMGTLFYSLRLILSSPGELCTHKMSSLFTTLAAVINTCPNPMGGVSYVFKGSGDDSLWKVRVNCCRSAFPVSYVASTGLTTACRFGIPCCILQRLFTCPYSVLVLVVNIVAKSSYCVCLSSQTVLTNCFCLVF